MSLVLWICKISIFFDKSYMWFHEINEWIQYFTQILQGNALFSGKVYTAGIFFVFRFRRMWQISRLKTAFFLCRCHPDYEQFIWIQCTYMFCHHNKSWQMYILNYSSTLHLVSHHIFTVDVFSSDADAAVYYPPPTSATSLHATSVNSVTFFLTRSQEHQDSSIWSY